MPRLQPGQAVVVRNALVQLVEIRRGYTFNAGATPEFGLAAAPALRLIDAAALSEFRALLSEQQKQPNPGATKEAQLFGRLHELRGGIGSGLWRD